MYSLLRRTVLIVGLAVSAGAWGQPEGAVVGLDPYFAAASGAYGVPLPLLKAVSYVETRWQMVQGGVEFAGVPAAFGVMGLRGPKLEQGARLIRRTPDTVRRDPQANILAAAALLRVYADEASLRCGGLEAWAPVLLRYGGITEPRSRAVYLEEIASVIGEGVSVKTPSGKPVASIRSGAKIRCPV